MKNNENFWKELDGYAARHGATVCKTGFAEQLEKMKREAFRIPFSNQERSAIQEEVASAERTRV